MAADRRTIDIPSLSGGVSTQPPSKRLPTEASVLDNCMVTVERSVEKRPGFRNMSSASGLDLVPLTIDPYYVWLQLDSANRYLILVDGNASGPTDTLFRKYRFDGDTYSEDTPAYQWDPTDSRLVWDGVEVISSSDYRYPLYVRALTAAASGTVSVSSAFNSLVAAGTVSLATRKYITYAGAQPLASNRLKTVQLGSSVIFLNTQVYAGFTSGTNNITVNLDGTLTGTDDVIGGKITYYTTVRVKRTTDGRLYPDGTTLLAGEAWDTDFAAKFIPVEDYVYGDFDKPWLGQSVSNFSELRLPPDLNDWVGNNSDLDTTPDDDSAREMLRILYDPAHPFEAAVEAVDGRGKVYFVNAPYLAVGAGYYRIINFPATETYNGVTGTGKPFTQRVRTPDNCSVIDDARMPQILSLAPTAYKNLSLHFHPILWTARLTGDRITNPGPSPFLTETGEARHVQLTAMCDFRDRLFLSAGDVVFSSQLGVYNNLWLDDPSNVTASDPIDVRASSNSYAEISAMVPFNDYLFINTKANVQFELKGENGFITPQTAEISSTSFYSTSQLVDPKTLGSQIFFWDAGRLYIYLNEQSRDFSTAVDLSVGVKGYLPSEYNTATVAHAQNLLLAVDNANRSDIYLYGVKFSGESLAQSAFWRYRLPAGTEIESIHVYDNYLYAVVFLDGEIRTILKSHLEREDRTIPRLDYTSLATFVSSDGIESVLSVDSKLPQGTVYVVLGDDFGGQTSAIYAASETSYSGGTTTITVPGIDLLPFFYRKVWVGVGYEMVIELSKPFLRNEQNNIVEGAMNIKTLMVRHAETGHYKVSATRRGRSAPLVTTFDGYEDEGTITASILGFSDETVIRITSLSPAPVNITQMEYKTVFSTIPSVVR
jgi:hypothetical protein